MKLGKQTSDLVKTVFFSFKKVYNIFIQNYRDINPKYRTKGHEQSFSGTPLKNDKMFLLGIAKEDINYVQKV